MKISFLCPSYNHERYVGEFIRSLQAQTESDWELLIVDDCSSDATVEKVREFHDSRIRLLAHDWNRGINAGLADALGAARAPLCSFIASDDLLEPDYAVQVLARANEEPDCGFGFVRLAQIDEHGRKTGKILGKVRQEERECLFARMFIDSDGHVSPGMFARTDLLRKIFPQPFGVCQLQDQLMIMQLAFYARPAFIDCPLVRYRQCGTGVSTLSAPVRDRLASEISVCMDEAASLFASDRDLRRHFGHLGKLPEKEIPAEDISFWLGRLALDSGDPERRHWGLRRVMSAFATADGQRALWDRYRFDFASYMKLFSGARLKPSKEQRKIARQNMVIKALVSLLAVVLTALLAMVGVLFTK